MRKLLFALVIVTLPAGALYGVLWSHYADGAPAEDRLGLRLNSYMPKPLRLWACERALKRDPDAFRPAGCW